MPKRKLALVLILVVCVLSLGACASGPHQLFRTVDDWDQQNYIDNPWLNGVLHFIPVIPIGKWFASIGDFFVTDAYSFWVNDAWDGVGTGFIHKKIEHPGGALKSLLIDDAKFLTPAPN